MSPGPIDVALAFVDAINADSRDRPAGLMTGDRDFVDSKRTENGVEASMTEGWGGYFEMVPAYRITVRETFSSGEIVMLADEAEGTFVQDGIMRPENHWRVPASWRAVLDGGKVAVRQVTVNPEPMTDILERIKGA